MIAAGSFNGIDLLILVAFLSVMWVLTKVVGW